LGIAGACSSHTQAGSRGTTADTVSTQPIAWTSKQHPGHGCGRDGTGLGAMLQVLPSPSPTLNPEKSGIAGIAGRSFGSSGMAGACNGKKARKQANIRKQAHTSNVPGGQLKVAAAGVKQQACSALLSHTP
jgi:hypothetical protein